MSFQDDLESDLEIFFDEAEFAVPVTYRPQGGSPVPALALFADKDIAAEDARGNHSVAEIDLKRSVVGIPSYNDTITIDGTDWKVVREVYRDKWVIRLRIRSDVRGNYTKR